MNQNPSLTLTFTLLSFFSLTILHMKPRSYGANTVFPFAFVTLGEIRSTWFDAMELPAASCKQCSRFHVRRTLCNRHEKK